MKKIAICGYTSAVGKYFIEKYRDEYEFIRVGRKNPDVYLDLCDCKLNEDMEKLCGCEALINFAADTLSGTDEEIIDLIQANVVGAMFLATLVHKYEIPRFIHTSSISATYDSEDPYYGYYAESKRSADAFIELYCKQNNISYTILRPSSLFGTEDFVKHQRFLYTLIEKVKNKENIQLYGAVDVKRNYLHVDTISEIVDRLIESERIGAFEAVNTVNDRISEIVDALNRKYDGNSQIEFLEDKPNIIERVFKTDGRIYDLLDMKKPQGIADELGKEEK